jgi:hypothetical protein
LTSQCTTHSDIALLGRRKKLMLSFTTAPKGKIVTNKLPPRLLTRAHSFPAVSKERQSAKLARHRHRSEGEYLGSVEAPDRDTAELLRPRVRSR